MMHLEHTLLMLPVQYEKGDPFNMSVVNRDHITHHQVGLSSAQDFLKSRVFRKCSPAAKQYGVALLNKRSQALQ